MATSHCPPIDPRILVSALECAGDAIEIADHAGRLIYVNAAFEAQTGYSRAEALGRTPAELTRSPVESPEVFDEAWRTIASGELWQGEFTRLRRDQTLILVEVTISPIALDEGRSTMFVAVSRDITQRREVEARIARSLTEKETLLKEIHHRVKNNLQIISSILSMARASARSEEVRTVLAESVFRVRSMALIHQHFYGFDTLEQIDLGAYASTLATSLRHALAPNVSISVDASPVVVGMDIAVLMGLILNELLTNALKYGASGPRPPGLASDIVVRVAAEAQRIVVEVLDSGPGLPDGTDLARVGSLGPSLGLKLVSVLCRQLRASATIVRAPAAGVRLELPATPP